MEGVEFGLSVEIKAQLDLVGLHTVEGLVARPFYGCTNVVFHQIQTIFLLVALNGLIRIGV
jgi:hypothetical protein